MTDAYRLHQAEQLLRRGQPDRSARRSGDGARDGQRPAARRLPRRDQGPGRQVRRLRSEATVKRASKEVRLNGGDPADAMLWRIRGRKGEGVTLWLPSTALVDALWRKHSARKATARDRKAERNAKRVNGSRTHGVKMSNFASLDSEAGQRGTQHPPLSPLLRRKTIPNRIGRSLASRGTEARPADRLGAHRRGMRARIGAREVRNLPVPGRTAGRRPLIQGGLLDSRCPRALLSAAAAVSAAATLPCQRTAIS